MSHGIPRSDGTGWTISGIPGHLYHLVVHLLAIHNFHCHGLQAGAPFHKCPLMYAGLERARLYETLPRLEFT